MPFSAASRCSQLHLGILPQLQFSSVLDQLDSSIRFAEPIYMVTNEQNIHMKGFVFYTMYVDIRIRCQFPPNEKKKSQGTQR